MPTPVKLITWGTEYSEMLAEMGILEGEQSRFIRLLIDEAYRRFRAGNPVSELNDKAVFIQFENEDELPADISNDVYSTMFNCSHVDGVRLFPYIEENGQKYFLVMLREDE